MTKSLTAFVALLIACCCAGAKAATVPYETSAGDVLSQLLESQICESMPHLPSCLALNDTLQDNSDFSPRALVFPDNQFMTVVFDYIATTQRLNRDLRERETEQVAKIARLEHDKERLEDQVRSLEQEWLPTVDKHPGTSGRSDVVSLSSSSASPEEESSLRPSYQPTANLLRPADCSDYLLLGAHRSGVYDIYPYRCRCSGPVKVWCDMETDGGGWTVILNRQNSSDPVNFTQPWTGYQEGFGNVSTEYWIGNDNLNVMTNTRSYTLRLDFEQKDGNFKWAEWPKVTVDNELHKYKLHVGSFNTRSMTDNCLAHHENRFFSTFDFDNDGSSRSCANDKKSGWWYHNCSTLDPTIPFSSEGHLNSACTYKVNGRSVALQGPSLQLKIRPQICSELVKAVRFNTHTCEGHNGY